MCIRLGDVVRVPFTTKGLLMSLFSGMFNAGPVTLEELIESIQGEGPGGPRPDSPPRPKPTFADLSAMFAARPGAGPHVRPLPAGLAAMLESIIEPGIRNGAAQAEKPPKVGQVVRRKFVQFVNTIGELSPPVRVEKRDAAALKNIPPQTIGVRYHDEVSTAVRVHRKIVVLNPTPCNAGRILFFTATVGTVTDLLTRKMLMVEEVRALRRSGLADRTLIVARPNSCICGKRCHALFVAPDPKTYRILTQI